MKAVFALLLTFALVLPIAADAYQNDMKPWTEWTQKEAEKMLTESPWARMQIDTDISEMFFQPHANTGPNSARRREEGATNQPTNLKYGIRFFSARPVRQALIRLMQLRQKDLAPDVIDRMKSFAEAQSPDLIIVAVTIEGTDQRSLGHAMQLFNSAGSQTLKNSAYLERNDGKRLFLEEYFSPGRDGFGARFIFPRMVDNQPFLTPESKDVRFVAELAREIRLNMQFKVSDMTFDGNLEY
jgi:hypothetical protein